jgi:hypothetical protein
MVNGPDLVARMMHLTVAYLGYHLQERQDLAYYFSEEFVVQRNDLAWSVSEGE